MATSRLHASAKTLLVQDRQTIWIRAISAVNMPALPAIGQRSCKGLGIAHTWKTNTLESQLW